ncbi:MULTISPECIES: hypothetical protein [unclassified Sutcliffiella]|uniref:hypothetical protein n=1 Tax=unclassified Sutcliffiella TaxID=2837532 RepID=UPI0030D3DC80
MNSVNALKFVVVLLFLVIVGLSALLLFIQSTSNNPNTDESNTYIMRNGEGGGGLGDKENGVMVKRIDGKKMYSTDGGQTWSETPPAGIGD